MSPTTDTPTIVPDLEEDKSPGPSGPRIRCPLCGWSPRKEDHWFCTCGHVVEYVRYGRRLPSLPAPVD